MVGTFFLSKWQFLGNDDGKFQRGCSCRITREGEQIYDGPLASLKRFKDDVKEVAAGYECGLVFEKFNDLQEVNFWRRGDAATRYAEL